MSIFNFAHINKTRYSTFNMSHDVKLSCEMGQLVPFLCQEILPGDKFSVTSETLVRMAPMLAPLMHRVDVRTEYFFVPNRILTPAWEKVMFPKPNKEPDVQIPYIDFQGVGILQNRGFNVNSWSQRFDDVSDPRSVGPFDLCSLADYLGLSAAGPHLADTATVFLNVLPFLAYQRIYNDYYRDENLMKDLSDMEDTDFDNNDDGLSPEWAGFGQVGNNNLFDLVGNLAQFNEGDEGLAANTLHELFQLRYRCWEKDYFTSALPWRQAGAPAVAPLQFDNNGQTVFVNSNGQSLSSSTVIMGKKDATGKVGPIIGGSITAPNTNTDAYNINNASNLGLSIADLQTASWLQRFLENIALGGHRMVEQILSHFGVRVPDYRLDRAEYLGGNRTPLGVSPIYQTSSSVEGSPLANPSGQAKSVGVNKAVTRTFEEHGFLIGIVSIIPRTNYSSGIHRMFQRFDRLDYAWPEFAMLGEQEVKMYELDAFDERSFETTFGYQQRYAEYKYINSSTHGDFADTLDFWHMAREFGNTPHLNSQFVECRPTSRIWSVPSATNHIWMMIHNNVLANRPLPQVSNSSLA